MTLFHSPPEQCLPDYFAIGGIGDHSSLEVGALSG
jgi:hypothetical protein